MLLSDFDLGQSFARSAQVMMAGLTVPASVPSVHYTFNEYLVFDLNLSAILSALYLTYYYALEPLAAVRSYSTPTTIC